jgi:hypothetical protein
MAIERMIQAGAVPITWLSFLLELQRDWARLETYEQLQALQWTVQEPMESSTLKQC